VLWLFTDAERLADPRPAVRRLPKALCGVVLRDDGRPDRAALGRDLARLCRSRRLALSVAGDARLARALGAGLHLRRGRRPAGGAACRFATSSAHSLPEVLRAGRSGAALVFLSPCFPTDSHPGAAALGPLRWAAIARAGQAAGIPGLLALGGMSGRRARALPRFCAGAGAIGALASEDCDANATLFRNCHGGGPGSVAGT